MFIFISPYQARHRPARRDAPDPDARIPPASDRKHDIAELWGFLRDVSAEHHQLSVV
jgi:hypothetical protein